MATLAKHGTELLRIDYLTCKLSYRSDGHILRNNGSGWKLWKKANDPKKLAAHTKTVIAKFDSEHPFYVQFCNLFHELVPFKARYMVFQALKILPNDPDGLYVELDESYLRYSDHNPALSIDDCTKLCQAYQFMRNEK